MVKIILTAAGKFDETKDAGDVKPVAMAVGNQESYDTVFIGYSKLYSADRV